jgi:hypothetical protein
MTIVHSEREHLLSVSGIHSLLVKRPHGDTENAKVPRQRLFED